LRKAPAPRPSSPVQIHPASLLFPRSQPW
jgi:hypothetical protein